MKKSSFIFIFVFITSSLFAQDKEDVVYLKNGSIIKGQITEMIPGKHIKIETKGGSLFVYKLEEIEKIEKQEITSPPTFRNVTGENVTTAQSSINNVFYWRVGYSMPSWKQFGFSEGMSEELNKSGAVLEMGKIYMIKSIPLPDNMSIGINADFFSIYWHRFSRNDNYLDIGTLRLDSKVGPSFTYTPVDKLALDVFVKADISWVTATAIVYENDDTEGYGKVGTVGISTGLNVRYSKLMLGFEYNTISPELENVDVDGDFLGNMEDAGNKSPLPSITFSIGMAF